MNEKDFFGREEPLRRLTAKIFRTQYPGPVSASLTGPPGIGKRALLKAAKKYFERTEHPDVFLIERAFGYKDVKASFLWDLLRELREVLTGAALQTRPAFTQTLWNNLNRAFEEACEWNPDDAASNMDMAGKKLENKFGDVMDVCQKLEVRVILILSSFDTVMRLEEKDWRDIIGFLDGISESRGREWNLTTLLVSERHPQFIAHSALSGSLFQIGYQPITLHNFDKDEMKLYFDSFPGGAPDETIQSAIVRHCGRYPKLLIDFRDSVSPGETLSEEQVRAFASQSQEALFHRLRTLLESQSVTGEDNYSALDAFRNYFLEKDKRPDFVMGEVYKLGLADIRPDGTYTPLTEYRAPAELRESAFLSYLRIEPSLQAGVSAPEESVIVSWLQLSDLHVSEEPDKEALLRSFKRLSERIRRPNFIVVTGDFQDKKAETDFTFAETYLNEILGFFGVAKENAYLVPGNHDANETTPSERKIIQSVTKNIANHYFCYDKHLKKLYARFSAFDAFCKGFYADVRDERFREPSRTKLLVWNDKLNLLCVNTALISDGKRDHLEITDLSGMEQALKGRKASFPTIMLGHHALSSLYPSHVALIEEFFRTYDISAYLHGDIHKSEDAIGARIDSTHVRPCLSCGKSAPKSGDNESDVGAVYYEWRNDGKVYVKWYKWYTEGGKRKLDEDRSFGPEGEDYSFPLIIK